MNIPVEIYPALQGNGLAMNAFIGRIPGLNLVTDRETALRRLNSFHEGARRSLGFTEMPFVTAEQVHGCEIGVVTGESSRRVATVDALITNQLDVCLGIYVADCCAVYALDTRTGSIGLAHSGRKGTELGIVPKMLAKMQQHFGTQPADVVLQLSPCIRPPHYEVDFAAEIVRQASEAGVQEIIDDGYCTASDLERFYSYRAEKGKTGRMLALFALVRQF